MTADEKLVRLLKRYAEAVTDVARLRAERDPLNKVLKQRQAEYEKSMAKHAELFPSVPEVQNLHRVKYAECVRSLDDQIQNVQRDVDSTAESIAQVVSELSQVQSRSPGTKVAAPIAVSQQQPEVTKKLQGEVGELKIKIRKIEAEHSQEQSDMKAEFARQCAEMKEQMQEMVNEMKKDMKKEVKAMKRAKEEASEEIKRAKEEAGGEIKKAQEEASKDVKEQLGVMRGELQKQQTKQENSQRNDLLSELSKHEQEWTKSVEQQLLAHKNSIDSVSAAEVSTMVQKESSALKSDTSDLLQRVEKLTGELAQNALDTVTLRQSLAAYAQRVEDEARRVEEHEAKISGLDTDALEEVAETMSIAFPDLQRRVANIQAKMDGVPQEIDTKQQGLFERVKQFVNGTGSVLGGLVDEVQNSVADHGTRIKTLEEKSTASLGGTRTAPTQPANVEIESVNSDMASIKTDFDSTKAAVDRLTRAHTGLSEQVNLVNQAVSSSSEELNDQLATLRHSITVLDAQFNNVSTRALAEMIIGQLEQIYPTSRQLTADVGALKSSIDNMIVRIDSLEGRVQDFKDKADSFVESKIDTAEVARMQEQLYKDLNGDTGPSAGHKRKRMDSGLNGAEHLVTNGAG
jgi:chromosome segregation ATPase